MELEETPAEILEDIDRMASELKRRLLVLNEALAHDNAVLDAIHKQGEKSVNKVRKLNTNLQYSIDDHGFQCCPWWISITVTLWIFTVIIIRIFPKAY